MSEFTVDVEREDDGRWIGEVTDLPGVLSYGTTREEAVAKAKALAFRVLADRLDHGEDIPELHGVFAVNGLTDGNCSINSSSESPASR
jgi:predicted RNase H-like HicB family nuclease